MASTQAAALNAELIEMRKTIMGTDVRPSLSDQRAAVETMINYATVPAGVETTRVSAGGVPTLIHSPSGGGNGYIHLHCHGGGLAMGSPSAWSRWLSHLATVSGRDVVNVGFRLTPEHPYPAGLEDVRAAFDWLAIEKGYPAEKIVIGGDSAGSTLALGTAQRLRDEGVVVGGVVLLSPWVDFTLTNPSIHANADTDSLSTPGALEMLAEFYAGAVNRADPAVSPGLGNLAGLPPLHIEASNEEILLDDAVRLAERARQEGVEVELKLWDVVPHVHQLFAGNLPEADESIGLISDFLRKRMGAGT